MAQPLVIFDLDGTLADTAPDLIAVINRVTAPLDLAPVNKNMIGNLVGQGARAMIARAFELQERSITAPQLDRLFDEFIKDYAANIAVHSRLFDGAIAAISELEQSGHRFAVCTNKNENLARLLLDELGILARFAVVTGGDTFAFKKPDGRHILETIALAGGSQSAAIMVGDSAADIMAAKAAKIPSIAVTFGYTSVPVESLGADAIISSFSGLPQVVKSML